MLSITDLLLLLGVIVTISFFMAGVVSFRSKEWWLVGVISFILSGTSLFWIYRASTIRPEICQVLGTISAMIMCFSVLRFLGASNRILTFQTVILMLSVYFICGACTIICADGTTSDLYNRFWCICTIITVLVEIVPCAKWIKTLVE